VESAEDQKIALSAAAKLAVKKGIIAAGQEEAYTDLLLTAVKKGKNIEE
jgi:hypothetical protein